MKSPYDPRGHLVIVDADGLTIEADTLQCVHCGNHFQVVPGSGRIRGFCRRCMGVTCGALACDPCVPFEARLDYAEGTKSTRATDIVEELLNKGFGLWGG